MNFVAYHTCLSLLIREPRYARDSAIQKPPRSVRWATSLYRVGTSSRATCDSANWGGTRDPAHSLPLRNLHNDPHATCDYGVRGNRLGRSFRFGRTSEKLASEISEEIILTHHNAHAPATAATRSLKSSILLSV